MTTVTSYSVSSQHDLIAAMAAIYAASAITPAAYTVVISGVVNIAGTLQLPAPVLGSSVTFLDAANSRLTGPGQLTFDGQGAGGGQGSVVLAAAGDFSGGVTLWNSTVSLRTGYGAVAGTGVITMLDAGPSNTLVIDGTYPLVNPINLEIGNPAYTPYLGNRIDVQNVVATAGVATLDSGLGITIPEASGGYQLEFNDNAGGGAINFLLTADISGGTWVTETNVPVANGVTVRGVGGTIFSVPFDNVNTGPVVQPIVDQLNTAVTQGSAIPFITAPMATLPAIAAGLTLEAIGQAGGAYALPTGSGLTASADFVANTTAAVTVTGGDANGQLVLAGTGGLTFTGGLGQGTVIAGGGANAVTIPATGGSQYVRTGDGNDTIVSYGGYDYINPGGGANLVKLGIGNDTVASTGADTIIGGSARDNISASGAALTFLGDGGSTYYGAGTVVGHAGSDNLQSTGAGLFFLGAGSSYLASAGADTVVAGSGQPTVAGSGQTLTYAGSGGLDYMLGLSSGATDTIVGASGGAVTVNAVNSYYYYYYGSYNTNLLAFANGGFDFEAGNSFGAAATIIGSTAAITVNAGAGGGAFIGGSAGGNVMNGSSVNYYGNMAMTQFIGGGNGDSMSGGVGITAMQPAAGATTMTAGSSVNLFAFVHGTVSNDLIIGFNPGLDYIGLYGFPAGEAAAALAGATTVGGNEVIALSDGTTVTFQGFTGLGSSNFI